MFGEPFNEYSGKPAEAIGKLLHERSGHVPKAIYKEGVGEIDFVWGEDGASGYGLAHIVERRNADGIDGESFARAIPEIICSGAVDLRHKEIGRIYISTDIAEVVIRLDWNGECKTWLVSAYRRKRK
ncbi:MAG: hypothetical protein LBV09_00540 [Deferribacteraceae bacterium]|jgi:hypothetical protein|nr:hypothetical protein [Deferribacteraceae bacterium]